MYPVDPLKNDEGTEFQEFRDQTSRDDFYQAKVEERGADRVFIVDKYEHSGVHYSIADTYPYPDRRWDVAPCAVLAVPGDATNPREYAEGMLHEFNAWCAGDCWIIAYAEVDTQGSLVNEIEALHGFLDSAEAERMCKLAAENGDI